MLHTSHEDHKLQVPEIFIKCHKSRQDVFLNRVGRTVAKRNPLRLPSVHLNVSTLESLFVNTGNVKFLLTVLSTLFFWVHEPRYPL